MSKLLLIVSLLLLISVSLSCGTTAVVTSQTSTIPEITETTTVTVTETATVNVTETVTATITLAVTPIKVKRQKHGSGQIVTLDMETEYLPVVVACENRDAPYESLKAQTIASRTFAYYKMLYEPRSDTYDILDYEADQVYDPALWAGLPQDKQEIITQAVAETRGLVIWHDGHIICSFYVSGEPWMLQYVTFNEGKSGDNVTQTTLDNINNPYFNNPYNRGCMGQIQANELALQGYNWEQILKYFYGADIYIKNYHEDY